MTDSILRRRTANEASSSADRALNLDSIRRLQESAGPFFVQLAALLEKLQPVIDQVSQTATKVWALLQPYHPHDLIPALYGLFLVFFGGVFMTIVASAEAAYQFGWEKIYVALYALYEQWTKASKAFELDNKVSSFFLPFFSPVVSLK